MGTGVTPPLRDVLAADLRAAIGFDYSPNHYINLANRLIEMGWRKIGHPPLTRQQLGQGFPDDATAPRRDER